MSALKAIHAGRKALGLDEDTYRAVLLRVTCKDSAGKMTEGERRAVVAEFRRLGFGPRTSLSGPYAGKLLALWLSAWNLGIVRNRTDQAMIAFVERQTGIGHVSWLRDARDARRAIEALKGWIAREAGVEWPVEDDGRAAKGAVIEAQWRVLERKGLDLFGAEANAIRRQVSALWKIEGQGATARIAAGVDDQIIALLGTRIREAAA